MDNVQRFFTLRPYAASTLPLEIEACALNMSLSTISPFSPIPYIDPALQYGGHCDTKSRGSANKRSIDVYHSVIINLSTVKQRVYIVVYDTNPKIC